jgi:hypothetical protein
MRRVSISKLYPGTSPCTIFTIPSFVVLRPYFKQGERGSYDFEACMAALSSVFMRKERRTAERGQVQAAYAILTQGASHPP